MDDVIESEIVATVIAKWGNEMEAHRKTRERYGEIQSDYTREVMLRRQSLRAMVREFFATFSVDMPESPAFPSQEVVAFRCGMIWEEYQELVTAIGNRDLVGVADAVADILYTTEGLALAFGIDTGPVLAEVHRSNLAKLGGPVREDGKILKPEGWTPPNIEAVLMAQTKGRAA